MLSRTLCVWVGTAVLFAGVDIYAVNEVPDVIPAVRQWQGAEGSVDVSGARVLVDKAYRKELGDVGEL